MRANLRLLLQMLLNASERVDMRTKTNMNKNYLSSLTDVSHDFASDLMFLLSSERAIIYIIRMLTY